MKTFTLLPLGLPHHILTGEADETPFLRITETAAMFHAHF